MSRSGTTSSRRGRLAIACAASLLLAASPARATKEKAAELYQHGMASFVLEQWDGAIRDFEEGFKEFPKPQFLYNIAHAHQRANRPAQAASYYRKYLDFEPEAT